jgi:choline dehydrogenase-like flavoprotein
MQPTPLQVAPAPACAAPGSLGGKDRVERGGELRIPVTKEEPELLDAACEVHEQVAGLLGHPHPGRVGGHPEDVYPAGGMLDREQHLQALQQHCVEEKTGRQDPLGPRGQELPPGQPGTARRWLDARSFEKQPHRARRDRVPKPAEFTWMRR